MINDNEKNKVYFSSLLKSHKYFETNFNDLTNVLIKHNIQFGFIKNTKDIWCRDYMPIQLSKNNFIQFRYEPSYLKYDNNIRSNPELICKSNGIQPIFSKINLDGGNIVQCSDRVIISDRIFNENSSYTSKSKLIEEIEDLLKNEVIIIPDIKSDLTGHADGMVRFVDRNTVVGNDRKKEYKFWTQKVNKILKSKGIDYIDVPQFSSLNIKYPYSAIGCYVNYLEVGNLIVLPVFEIEGNEDQRVIDLFERIFSNRILETVNYNKIGFHGGLLNCSTWTVKQ